MRTSIGIVVSIVTVLGLGACSKKDDKGGGAGASKAAPPFSGTLTTAALTDAKNAIKPFQKWTEADATLASKVGKPKRVDGAKQYWYVLEGDQCWELSVENTNGEVGSVGLGQFSDGTSQFKNCKP